MYEKIIKRLIDIVLSVTGLILLSPIFLILWILVKVDDPGPAMFKQKRVGKDKKYFYLHKFRSMKIGAPVDTPTHLLKNPEQYITRVGKFLRKSSLDELPQVWDIFVGNMSVIGPRPALYNQEDLVAERDKYSANDVRPGLTGWAQINGRDELEIPVKAKLDGDYVKILKKGGFKAFAFDLKCFFGTIFPVLRGEGIVEGQSKEQDNHRNDDMTCK
ncbi:MAG: sugar transferase [Lachnospiraceae bacterium]|nr:sugar transferase [Lachnospiraceae bacterium]